MNWEDFVIRPLLIVFGNDKHGYMFNDFAQSLRNRQLGFSCITPEYQIIENKKEHTMLTKSNYQIESPASDNIT